jgi:hypothetical protein
MGRFTCVACGTKYYDKRFFWEADAGEGCDEDFESEGSDDRCSPDAHDDSCCNAADGAGELRVYGDTARATGTLANITGAVAQYMAPVCAPISVVGGAAGVVSGAYQLHSGLNLPSGNVDPHLVTKGGVATSVGCTCMALGVGAAFAPGLFFVAVGLGVTGLSAATAIDCNMDGLCKSCQMDCKGSRRTAATIAPSENVTRETNGELRADLMAKTSQLAASPLPYNPSWIYKPSFF